MPHCWPQEAESASHSESDIASPDWLHRPARRWKCRRRCRAGARCVSGSHAASPHRPSHRQQSTRECSSRSSRCWRATGRADDHRRTGRTGRPSSSAEYRCSADWQTRRVQATSGNTMSRRSADRKCCSGRCWASVACLVHAAKRRFAIRPANRPHVPHRAALCSRNRRSPVFAPS